MNSQIVFYNETGLNGKYQVKTSIELTGKEINKIQSNSIHTHKNNIYKGLNNYWVSKKELESIKENYNSERTYF